MTNTEIDISIIIVNYKVKEYIANLLNSIRKASAGLNLEIFVVDNNSGDDSIEYLKKLDSDVIYIQNNENIGFGKANNQAIRQAKGKYSLIINPDTLISEDTLQTLFNHMEKNEDCGACGCKILNPDGTFAPESRRSVPTIWSAACKVFGLNVIFPKSKLFGKYYLSWLDENEPSKIPVLSGAFMFWRTSVLKKLEGFDERFFMYGEDIDLSFRIQQTEYHIDYVPSTSIIHYKGESTKKGNLKYIRLFNKALYQFFDKQYSSRYSLFFKTFIYVAVLLRTIFSFIGSRLRQAKIVLFDILIINVALFIGYGIRFSFNFDEIFQTDNVSFLWINVLFSGLYFMSAGLFGLYKSNSDSISAHLKALFLSFGSLIIITFFARSIAFSRLIFAIAFVIGVIFTILYRVAKMNTSQSDISSRAKLRSSKVLIVGRESDSLNIASKIHTRPDWNYEVIGYVSVNEKEVNALGSISQLKDLINAYNVNQVFFALNSISYKQMLKEISSLQKVDVIFKLIPDSMDYILGKSNVEYMEAIPLVEVEFSYSKAYNKVLKRSLDLALSIPLFLFGVIILAPSLLIAKNERLTIGGLSFYKGVQKNLWKNRLLLLGYIIKGKLSFVGAPIHKEMNENSTLLKGVTGLVQISEQRISTQEDAESFELYYLQNYSIWMDLDIILKTIFKGPSAIEQLAKAERLA